MPSCSFFQCYFQHRDLHSFPTRRSSDLIELRVIEPGVEREAHATERPHAFAEFRVRLHPGHRHVARSEEHTSELQSLRHLVCRLLLEKKKKRRPPDLSLNTLKHQIIKPM